MVSLDFLLESWEYFIRDKRKRKDIQPFSRHLEDHLFEIQNELMKLEYQHGQYHSFTVFDPKIRCISKASVKDRLIHQIIYATLVELFDKRLIFHSFSCRLGKGVHQGTYSLRKMIGKVSRNGKRPCYALKMDIRKFFDNVNHDILKMLLRRVLKDEKILIIVDRIIDSFTSGSSKKGLPLGNVTSQLFANIYLHELDLFIKHDNKEKYYVRYCDDCVILSEDRNHLLSLIPSIALFLKDKLDLELHPKKVIIRSLHQGIDFLGQIFFLHHKNIRTKTKQRIIKKLQRGHSEFEAGTMDANSLHQRLQSYLGTLSHTNQHKLCVNLKNAFWTAPRLRE